MDATNLKRRRFLQSASALGLGAALAEPAALAKVTPARAEDMKLGPESVRFRPEIEPVVRWIEEAPRDQAIEVAVARLREGLSYRDLLAGLFLAGIRNVKPRPVGFKFHAVLVINSAHLLGQTAPADDRLLPLLWALDTFKGSQVQDAKEGDWTLGAVDEARLPSATQARAAFDRAMVAWDADAADAATAALCRSSGAAGAMEPFWRYAVRDQRNIGHKAIFAAQSWRTLQAIGWPHAEPVLRSLAFGMLDLQGDANPAPVGPYDANLALAATIRPDWTAGRADAGATRALLETIRHATPEAASAEAAAMLNRGISAESIWDAAVLGGSELLLRRPGILAIHAVTSINALHFIASASGDDTTRRLALLQAVGWLPLFRDGVRPPSAPSIDALEAADPGALGDAGLAEAFAAIGRDRKDAAARALGYLERGGSADNLFATARRMVFHKGRDSHDYKYAAAAWEEFTLASDPRWRAPLAAATMANLPNPATPDSPLMRRAREAVARAV